MRALPLALFAVTLLCPALAKAEPSVRSGTASSPPLVIAEAKPEQRRLLKIYQTPRKSFDWKLERTRKLKTYEKWKLTFPSAITTDYKPNNTVHGNLYRPRRGKGPFPAVVILHHLGGGNEAEEILAAHFAQHGVVAVSLLFPFYGPRRPKDFSRKSQMLLESLPTGVISDFAKQAVIDSRDAADFLRSQADVDPKRVSLLGISMGAIFGALTAGVDGRFEKVVLILGGGDLAKIFFHGSSEVRQLLDEVKKRGLTEASLRELMKGVDPLTYADRIDTRRVLMLNAWNDEIVPRDSTLALHAALGEPEIHWYRTGHYGAVLHIFNIMRRSLHFVRGPKARRK